MTQCHVHHESILRHDEQEGSVHSLEGHDQPNGFQRSVDILRGDHILRGERILRGVNLPHLERHRSGVVYIIHGSRAFLGRNMDRIHGVPAHDALDPFHGVRRNIDGHMGNHRDPSGSLHDGNQYPSARHLEDVSEYEYHGDMWALLSLV